MFKIEKRSLLVEQAANQIREVIQSGQLKPGDRLIETDLANKMQIGRNAVREAIRYLEKEGLVTTIPFKGAQVSEFSEKDLEEVYTLRTALEELAIRTLVKHLDTQKIEKLESVLHDMERVARQGSVKDYIDADLRFHQAICELSEHRKLLDTWLTLTYQMRAFIGVEGHFYEKDTPDTLWKSHIPIVDAIKAGDSDLAVKHMTGVIAYGYRNASQHYINKQDTVNADDNDNDN
ncbi:MAG: GntR family transcriptional regulator [bacterium]|nr:GntR family transcriptional regulator [bacterium]